MIWQPSKGIFNSNKRDGPKNEDDPKNEEDPINEDDTKNEYYPKNGIIRGAATESWTWLLGSHFFIVGLIELIF